MTLSSIPTHSASLGGVPLLPGSLGSTLQAGDFRLPSYQLHLASKGSWMRPGREECFLEEGGEITVIPGPWSLGWQGDSQRAWKSTQLH